MDPQVPKKVAKILLRGMSRKVPSHGGRKCHWLLSTPHVLKLNRFIPEISVKILV